MAQVSFISATKLAKLLKNTNARGDTYVRVLTKNQLALGVDPLNPTHVIDFSEEATRSISSEDTAQEPRRPPERRKRVSRRTGKYLLEIKGDEKECGSLKELLSEGLKALERHQPGTLAKLTTIRPRSKRIVARDPALLFKQPKLADKYAEKLINGWWFGTNNSADETVTWLRRGCDLAGLEWDREVVVALK